MGVPLQGLQGSCRVNWATPGCRNRIRTGARWPGVGVRGNAMPPDTAPAGTGNVGAHRPGVVREHARIGDLRAVRIFDRNPGCRSTMSQASDIMQKARRLPTFFISSPYPCSKSARVGPCSAARHGPAAGPVRLLGAASIRRPAGGDQASPTRNGGTCPAGGYGWGRCTLMIRPGDGG